MVDDGSTKPNVDKVTAKALIRPAALMAPIMGRNTPEMMSMSLSLMLLFAASASSSGTLPAPLLGSRASTLNSAVRNHRARNRPAISPNCDATN